MVLLTDLTALVSRDNAGIRAELLADKKGRMQKVQGPVNMPQYIHVMVYALTMIDIYHSVYVYCPVYIYRITTIYQDGRKIYKGAHSCT